MASLSFRRLSLFVFFRPPRGASCFILLTFCPPPRTPSTFSSLPTHIFSLLSSSPLFSHYFHCPVLTSSVPRSRTHGHHCNGLIFVFVSFVCCVSLRLLRSCNVNYLSRGYRVMLYFPSSSYFSHSSLRLLFDNGVLTVLPLLLLFLRPTHALLWLHALSVKDVGPFSRRVNSPHSLLLCLCLWLCVCLSCSFSLLFCSCRYQLHSFVRSQFAHSFMLTHPPTHSLTHSCLTTHTLTHFVHGAWHHQPNPRGLS